MKKIVTVVALITTFAIAGSAFAGSCCPSKKNKDGCTTGTVTTK